MNKEKVFEKLLSQPIEECPFIIQPGLVIKDKYSHIEHAHGSYFGCSKSSSGDPFVRRVQKKCLPFYQESDNTSTLGECVIFRAGFAKELGLKIMTTSLKKYLWPSPVWL